MEQLLRASAVAALLGLKSSSVYQLARDGVLPHVRVAEGRKRAIVRFRAEDIARFIADRVVTNATAK